MGVEMDPVAFIVQQTRANVDFLVAQHQISAPDGRLILNKLPGNDSSASVDDLSRNIESVKLNPPVAQPVPAMPAVAANPGYARSPPPPPKPSLFKTKALWGYNEQGESNEDLTMHSGDIVDVTAETNGEWWSGRVNGGKEGLFPSNYVERLPPPSASRGPSSGGYAPPQGPPSGQYQPSMNAPNGPYGNGPPTYYPPTQQGNGYYQPPPPQQYQQQPQYGGYQSGPPPEQHQAAAAEPPKESKMGKLGDTMATSAAGGFGFGAGSAAGSSLINSIF